MRKVIRFGSRRSELALAQTRIIMDTVAAAHPELDVEIVPMTTTGDVNMKPFSEATDKFGIKGLFTQELEEALRSGEIDVAVHSLKDVPMFANPDLPIVACSKRGDPRDALVLPLGAEEIDELLPVGCSSARRALQLPKIFPNVFVDPIRGNVNTRLRKLDDGEFSALVLAAAGLSRIGQENRISRYFSPEEIVPAPGQGIIACQGRAGEPYDYLKCVNSVESTLCAAAERGFSAELGGGCSLPVGAYAWIKGETMRLLGFYADEEIGKCANVTIAGDPKNVKEAAELGRTLAEQLKEEILL